MSLASLLNQLITIYNQSSYDAYGRTSVGSGTTAKARFQAQKKRIILGNGDVATIDAVAYVPSDTTVDEDDRVNYDSNDYKVLSAYPTPDGKGDTRFIKLELIKWQT